MAPHPHPYGAVFFSLFRAGVEAVAARLAFFPPNPPTYDVLPAQDSGGKAVAEDYGGEGAAGGGDDDDDDEAERRLGRGGHCRHRRRRSCRRASNSFFFDDTAHIAEEDGGGDPAEDDASWPAGGPEHRRRRSLNGRRLEIVPIDSGGGGGPPAVRWPQAQVSYVRVPRGLPRGAGGGATVAGGYDIVVAWVPFYFDEDDAGREGTTPGSDDDSGGGLRTPPPLSDDGGGGGGGARADQAACPVAAAAANNNNKDSDRRTGRRRRARCTILFSHGNATDLGRALPLARELGLALRCNVVCYEYAGYGRAGGLPGVSNTLADAAAALRHACARHGVEEADVVLYGQSLGSGPSVWLAARRSTARLRWRREAEQRARRLQRQAVREAAAAAGAAGGSRGSSSGGGSMGGGGNNCNNGRALSAALSLQRRLDAASGRGIGSPSLNSASTSSAGLGGSFGRGSGGGGRASASQGDEDGGGDDDGVSDEDGGGGCGHPPGVAGLILHSPIASGVRALAPGLRHWPAPLDVFPNARLIRRVTCCPTLVAHGTADAVINASAGVRLAELCPRLSLPPLFVRGAGHDDLAASPLYLPRLRAFLGECFPDCDDYNDWGPAAGAGSAGDGGVGAGAAAASKKVEAAQLM